MALSTHGRVLAALALVVMTGVVPAVAGNTVAHAAEDACADGVPVVVDFTDVGGEVEVGCAAGDPENGRAALLEAGFTPVDSVPGLLCTIDEMPDPCPETFQGSFWSYWYGTPGDEWTTYQVGADMSDPAPGQVEGWRYNDGTTPPGIEPGAAAEAITGAAGDGATETTDAAQPTTVAIVVGTIALLALVVILIIRSRRRSSTTHN